MDKQLYDLQINSKFERLCPPLRGMELRLLEDSILANGCEQPLVVWKGMDTIIDGHNRYRICKEHSIPFAIREEEFADENDAIYWIVMNQLGRRNLSTFAKCELLIPLEEILKRETEKRGRERRIETWRLKRAEKEGGSVPDRAPNLSGKTRDIVAEMADVSHTTYERAKRVIVEADEETKEKLRQGELSVYGVFSAIQREEKKKREAVLEPTVEEKTDGGKYESVLKKPIMNPDQTTCLAAPMIFDPLGESRYLDNDAQQSLETNEDENQADEFIAESHVKEMANDFLNELNRLLESTGAEETEHILEAVQEMADTAILVIRNKMKEMEE